MNKTYELQGGNFKVVNENNNIVVSHAKPFKMIKGGKSVPARLVEGQYTMSTTGLIINNTLPFDVELVKESVNPFPLIASLIAESVQTMLPTKTSMFPFNSLKIGDEFIIDGDTFVKESVNSYIKKHKLLSIGTPVVVESADLDVLVENRYNVLSPEQVRNIVQHLPVGLDEDDLYDEIHNTLDDIAGFESEEDRDTAVNAIAQAYMSVNHSQDSLHEAKNHEGNSEYKTYAAWKRACKGKHADCTFEGDKDIAQAFATIDGKKMGIGEWDGATGYTNK